MSSITRPMVRHFGVLTSFLLSMGAAQAAFAQAEMKVNEDVILRFGVLGQFTADTIDDTVTDENTDNLFVRRLRVIAAGTVAKRVSFLVETDTPNLGKTLPTGKNIQPGVIFQDAYGEFRLHQSFALDAGLMLIPFSRNSLQSAAMLLPIDYGVNTFNQSAPEEESNGRDTGFQAKGYLVGNRLEYRVGAFQGRRDVATGPLRYAGRVQYNFLDPEISFVYTGTDLDQEAPRTHPGRYTGTYLGRKRVLAVGAAFDAQDDYRGYAADVFFDHALGPGAITAQVDWTRFDGGATLPSLARQNDVLVEAGYYVRKLGLTPFLQYTWRDILRASTGDEDRVSIGAAYWWRSYNANFKGAYTRIDPSGLDRQHEFTIQLQLYYF